MNGTTEKTKAIVSTIWRAECRLLGKPYVDSAVIAANAGQVQEEFIKKIIGGGDSFDLKASAEIVFQATVFVSTVITIVKNLRDLLKRDPTTEEVTKEMEVQKAIPANPAVRDEKEKVLDAVIQSGTK